MPRTLLRYLRNLFRPWKLVTFALGLALFVWGADHFDAPTWDIGVSWIMSVLCYLLAPYAVDLLLRAILERQGRWHWRVLFAIALLYLIASGSYEIYNTIRMGQHPITYWYNLGFSIPVALIAGFIWRYDGSISDFIELTRASLRTRDRTR